MRKARKEPQLVEPAPLSDQETTTIEAMKNVYDTFVDIIWKAVGFVLIGIGWLCTSGEARAFVGGHASVRWLLTLVAGVTALSNIGVLTRLRMQSRALKNTLREGLLPKVKDAYLFDTDLYVPNLAIVQILIAAFIVFVWKV